MLHYTVSPAYQELGISSFQKANLFERKPQLKVFQPSGKQAQNIRVLEDGYRNVLSKIKTRQRACDVTGEEKYGGGNWGE